MNDDNLTINTPAWLVLLVVVLLVSRAFIGVMEHFYQHDVSGINWLAASKADLSGRSYQPKLVFYSFTAADNDSCNKMNTTSFLSREIVSIVNEQFVPVRIQNIEVLDDSEASKLIAELQQKFAVFVYPTIVVTLPSGKVIESHGTYIGPKSLMALLQRCLKKAKYVEALDYLAHAKYYQATKAFREWLRTMPGNSKESANGRLYCALAYKMLSDMSEARNILGSLVSESSDSSGKNIANLLGHFLVGDIGVDELLQETEGNGNRDPRVYYFIAMLEIQHKNIQNAIRYLNLAAQNISNSPEVQELVDSQLNTITSTR